MICRSVRLIPPFVAFLSVGCGTAHNLNPTGEALIKGPGQDDPSKTTRVFGGVRSDLTGLTTLSWNDEYSFLNFIVLPFYVADLPLSLVGDTVTLPYTAVYALFSQRLTLPKAAEEGESPQATPGNALSSLAGNKFTHPSQWTHGFIEMPLATKVPDESLSKVPPP